MLLRHQIAITTLFAVLACDAPEAKQTEDEKPYSKVDEKKADEKADEKAEKKEDVKKAE